MKKRGVTLTIALLLLISLFAGCGGGGTTPATQAPATEAPATQAPATQAPATQAPASATPAPTPEPTPEPAPASPYNLAAGKFQKGADGFPTAPYEYELPMSTTDEVLSFWTSTFMAQYIPEEGYGSMPLPAGVEELTGVHVEYQVVPWDTRSTNFSTLLAADDLPDMMAQGITFYNGGYYEAVEDGFFANIHDYMDYCPNYIYEATKDKNDTKAYDSVFYAKDLIVAFYNMWTYTSFSTNKVIRQDLVEKVGMKVEDIVTWDDWFNVLSAVKSQVDKVEYPWPLTSAIEVKGYYVTSPSFDTLSYLNSSGLPDRYIKDGVVTFGDMTEGDRAYMQKMNEFYAAGLIDPNWTGYASSASFTDKISRGEVLIMDMAATEISGYNKSSVDEDCDWTGLKRPVRYEGQVLHCGGDVNRVQAGSCSISAKCENIPLAVTWCDFRYSPYGSFYHSYGPQGVVWDYDENGNIRATEWALNHEMGFSWICSFYALNNIFEHGLEDINRKLIYDGGDKIIAVRKFWMDYPYDGAYEFPVGCRMSADDEKEVNDLSGDISTYILENYGLFLTGDRPFDEWDAYVDAIYDMGMQNIIDIYQAAYDSYKAA